MFVQININKFPWIFVSKIYIQTQITDKMESWFSCCERIRHFQIFLARRAKQGV